MRAIVALYLVIGVVLLAIGFLLPGPCPNRNTDVVNNLVFVLTWPVGLYSEVYHGQLSAQEWLQRQACEGAGAARVGRVVAFDHACDCPPQPIVLPTGKMRLQEFGDRHIGCHRAQGLVEPAGIWKRRLVGQ